ncbi:MAG: HDIG domain-containing protein [Candidatus Bathyarchaeia archaeon]
MKKAIEKIKDKTLKEKVIQFLENPTIEINGKVYSGLPLESSPAGLTRHHNYPGGFIEHIVATVEIALALCNITEKVYHGKVNRDFVIAGALLHDIFKPLTYERRENGTYSPSALAERLDHLTLVVSEMIRRNFPLDLIHIVGAHLGGQYGPIWPRTIEALICHLADLADSRLNGEVLRAAQYLCRQATGEEIVFSGSKEAFDIVYSKETEGWEGVKKVVEKIKEGR